MVEKERTFPRGGGGERGKEKEDVSSDRPEDFIKRKKRKADDDDDLFSVARKTEKKRKKNEEKKKKTKKDKEKNEFSLAVRKVENLAYWELSEGMSLLSAISSIAEYELKLSLPGRLVATVPITAISDPYTRALREVVNNEDLSVELRPLQEMFYVGQMLPCSVTSITKNEDGFYKVEASLNPLNVNGFLTLNGLKKGSVISAAVASVEDHGYIMDVGIKKARAFLTKKRASKYIEKFLDDKTPTVGQLIPCVVTQIDVEGQNLHLSANPAKLKSSVVPADDTLNIHSMLPGMTFSVKYVENLPGGIKVKIGNAFNAYIHKEHFDDNNEDEFEEEMELEARILYILPTVNTIYMSLRQGLKYGEPKKAELKLKIGDLVKDCLVINVDKKTGISLRSPDKSKIHVALRLISDSKIDDLKKKFPVGSKRSVKILNYDPLSSVFLGSMQKSVLHLPVDLEPGVKVTATVKQFVSKGLIVSLLPMKREAFIPKLHLSDVPLKNPEKKFQIGEKLNCRVLRVNPEKRKLHLTAKPILVKEEYPVVSTYNQVHVGKVTEGVAVVISNSGLVLSLFGDVKGWVPKSLMSIEPIEYPEKLFFSGQVLKCKVIDVDEVNEKMTLSLIIHKTSIGTKMRKAGNEIKLGHSYSGVIVKDVAKDGLGVEIEGIKCFIPKHHLTDHPSLVDMKLQTFSVGDVLNDCLCFEKDVLPILTMKPLLINYNKTENKVNSYQDLHQGLVLPGVICLIKKYGVFLRLPTWKFRKSALVPMRYLADFFVEDVNDVVTLHQTLFGKVIERNDEEQRITMSAKVKDILNFKDEHNLIMSLMISYFRDIKRISQNVKHKALSNYAVGMIVICTVKSKTDMGMLVLVNDKVKGIITKTNEPKNADDEKLSAVVIYVDYEAGVLELSAKEDLVTSVTLRNSEPVFKSDSLVKATPVLIRSEFNFVTMVITSPKNYEGHFLHLPTRSHINDFVGFSDLFSTEETYNVFLKDTEFMIGVLEKKRDRKIHKRSESEADKKKKSKNVIDINALKSVMKPIVKEEEEEKEKGSKPEKKPVVEAKPLDFDEEDEDFNPWGGGSLLNKDEEEVEVSKKIKTHLSKKEKKELDRMESEEIARAEQRVLDGEEEIPETEDEFERLVLASPNSSICWIKFMAFYMEKQNYEKAREIVKRALEKINFREEEERLNVYIAWFNLENSVGTEEDAENVLKEALKANDQYKVYNQVAAIYTQTGKVEKAEKMYKMMVRKFARELDVWTKLGLHYFKVKNFKEARFTLQRSIQNLDKKDHVTVTTKFAIMEFKFGEPERGKTIFETILGNYPRRIDLWCVYVDSVIKAGEIETAREIFERMITLNLQPKKMKTIFKKYIDFETSQNDQFKVDRIRKKALEYVESKVGLELEGEEEEPMDIT